MRHSITVVAAQAGKAVAAVVRELARCSWSEARRRVRLGQVRVDGRSCRNPSRPVRRGQRLEFAGAGERTEEQKHQPARKDQRQRRATDPRPVASGSAQPRPFVRYADRHIVVVDKPAGLTTVRHAAERKKFGKRAERFLPPTLADLLPNLVDPGNSGRLRAVHRLDKETSGLLVFARTEAAERNLGQQMRAHTAGRKYLALVRGQPSTRRIESHLVADRGDGRRGSSDKPGDGKRAVTNVRLLEPLGDFSLVECELETGRTHQVRIHLGEHGTPLCGERVYDRPPHGAPLPDDSGAVRPMLHASFLEITHPATGRTLSWTAPMPADMKTLLKKLRQQAKQ